MYSGYKKEDSLWCILDTKKKRIVFYDVFWIKKERIVYDVFRIQKKNSLRYSYHFYNIRAFNNK